MKEARKEEEERSRRKEKVGFFHFFVERVRYEWMKIGLDSMLEKKFRNVEYRDTIHERYTWSILVYSIFERQPFWFVHILHVKFSTLLFYVFITNVITIIRISLVIISNNLQAGCSSFHRELDKMASPRNCSIKLIKWIDILPYAYISRTRAR